MAKQAICAQPQQPQQIQQPPQFKRAKRSPSSWNLKVSRAYKQLKKGGKKPDWSTVIRTAKGFKK